MRHLRVGGVLILLLALGWSGLAQEKKPDGKGKAETKDKVVSAGKVTGRLVSAEAMQRNLTVQVNYVEVDPAKVAANQAFLVQRQLEIRRTQDPREQARQLAQLNIEMQRRQADIYRQVQKNIDLRGTDDMKVRVPNPPPGFDEKGNPKKYTAKELKELKGPNLSLPGYTGEFESLRPGQLVEVHLAKSKTPPKPVAKDKGKDPDKEVPAPENRPHAFMVVVLQEAPLGK